MKPDVDHDVKRLFAGGGEMPVDEAFTASVMTRVYRLRRLRLAGQVGAGLVLVLLTAAATPHIVTATGMLGEVVLTGSRYMSGLLEAPAGYVLGIAAALTAAWRLRAG